jgi:transcriptional regulator with XRE-family HTH domain
MEQVLFGERLKNAREAAGLSRKAMANNLGVKLATIDKWESGKMDPRANRLQMLASLLNVPLVWLLAGSQEVPDHSAGVSDSKIIRQKIDSLKWKVNELKSEIEDLEQLAEAGD